MKKKLLLTMVLMFSLFILFACSNGDSEDVDSGEDSGEVDNDGTDGEEVATDDGEERTLVYATETDIIGLSPIDTSHGGSGKVIGQIHETLFVTNPETSE